MWVKVVVTLGLIGCVFALRNPPLVTKFGSNLNKPGVRPFIANPPETYRLPNDSLPFHYDLHLVTGVQSNDFTFKGFLKIKILVKEDTDEIVLHSKQQNITSINLYDQDFTSLVTSNLNFTKIESHDFLVIKLNATKVKDETLGLQIDFTGTLREDQEGFYRGEYVNEQNVTVSYATTQFEIAEARHAFPCYDEPGIRAPIKLAISYQSPFKAIANMPANETIDDPIYTNYKKTFFQETPPMQTYLLAFLISDYEFMEAPEGSTRINQSIYGIPKVINDGWANYSASIVGDVVKELDKYTGFDYPLPKLDHAALTTFKHGAMENFGLITYIDSGLLVDPSLEGTSRTYKENGVVGLITHETAHQWFGDVISPQWWSYTWLNEGFATFLANVIPSKIYPDRNLMKNFVRSNIPAAMGTDENPDTWSMNHYTEVPADLWTKFNNIGYSKAACVIRMFQEVMTEVTFTKGLKYYLNANEMQAATPDHLHGALQQAYDEDYPSGPALNIGQLMGTWESQAGYPLVSVKLNGANVEFSQARYPNVNNEIYSIPLTYSTKGSNDFTKTTPMQWLTGKTLSVANIPLASGDWIILNNQQVGYYRADYSTELWTAIINQLKTDYTKIHAINRAVLRDEIYLGWRKLNRTTAAHVLDSLLYFKNEDEAISWSKSNQLFTELTSRLSGSEIYGDFTKYLRDLTNPQLAVIGYEGINTEHTDLADLRGQLKNWNCQAEGQTCLERDNTAWLNYHNNNNPGSFSFCYALRSIDSTLFYQILSNVTTDLSFKSRGSYLSSLGCNINEENLKALFAASIDTTNNLSENERMTVLKSAYSRSYIGLKTTMSFIDEKHANISAVNGTQFVGIYKNLAQYVNPNLEAEFNALSQKLRDASYLTGSELDSVKEVYAENKKWHETNYVVIKEWFEAYNNPTTPSPSTPTPSTTTPGGSSAVISSLSVLVFCAVLRFVY